MRFAIRDDDTNFFTDPDELIQAYGQIWDFCPPTLSVITHVKGDWPAWTKKIYQFKHEINWDHWRKDDTVFPLHDNQALVKFLKENLQKEKIDVSFHAVHHRNEDRIMPTSRSNNYVLGAEFFTSENQDVKIKSAIEYLKVHVNKKVTVFTPPQNLLSLKGYKQITHNNLSIVGAGIPFWKKEMGVRGLKNMVDVGRYKLKYPGRDYPFLLRFRNHSEIIHHYPLHPTTRVENLIQPFNHVRENNGVFVLSTHYHEFNAPLTYDSQRTMKDVLLDFLQYVKQTPNVQFTTLTKVFESTRNREIN